MVLLSGSRKQIVPVVIWYKGSQQVCSASEAPLWLLCGSQAVLDVKAGVKQLLRYKFRMWELKLSLGETIINILQEHLPTVKP